MKIFIRIDDTGGYPRGIVAHMIEAIQAYHFHLNYFYDANIFINLANRPFIGAKHDKEKGKSEAS